MKYCSYCGEENQDTDTKCAHCGGTLMSHAPPPLPGNPLKWYFRTTTVVIALLSVGPLALPLVWWHPKLNLWWKTGVSLVTVVLTWYAYKGTMEAFKTINEQMETLRQSGLF